jgi:hypothetical protein
MKGGTSGPESAAGTPEQLIERLQQLRGIASRGLVDFGSGVVHARW